VAAAVWTDLLDPSLEELREHARRALRPAAADVLLAPSTGDGDRRPRLQGQGEYVLGVFLVPVLVPEEDRVYYQELDLVASDDAVLTVRKTPAADPPLDVDVVRAAVSGRETAGEITYGIADEVAERYLDLIDGVGEEIEELDDNVDAWSAAKVRTRISSIRHDLLHIRRALAPTRDAIRGIVDGRVELAESVLFPRDVELAFGNVYDKLLRASEALDFARDLLGSVRDYVQSKIATEQNEVMKRLTAIASLLLLPTFIVGLYGQNFEDIPELSWRLGYAWSWGAIVVTTLIQLLVYRWRRWL
jgi:magnesium transporter